MELEEYIKDGFDDSLRDYIQSEDYLQKQTEVDEMIKLLLNNINPEQRIQFNRIVDAITSEDSKLALTAYVHGVVEGIALRNKIIK